MAFTGVAQYNIPNEIGEDVSRIVSMISPKHTPFLDLIGDSQYPIFNKVYSWEEDALLPETFSNSSAIASTAATSNGVEVGANAGYLRVGDILRNRTTTEMMLVNSIGTSAATIYVQRAYAGTTANSSAAGVVLEFLSSAVEEGGSPRQQRRVGKTLKSNYVQTFREDVVVSNLANNAVMKWQLGGNGQSMFPGSPYDEEVAKKSLEVLVQLERAVLMGRTNGNTIGASNAETTVAGIYNSIATTNIVSHATFSNSIVNNMIATIDAYTDVRENAQNYVLLCGDTAFRRLSNAREARFQQSPVSGEAGVALPTLYFSDYGTMPIAYSRRVPAGSILCLRKDFINIKPFAGNSFSQRKYDDGSSAAKGYVEGTYGLEFRQSSAHGRLDGLA